jgi:hypothetical protein
MKNQTTSQDRNTKHSDFFVKEDLLGEKVKVSIPTFNYSFSFEKVFYKIIFEEIILS